MTIGLRRNGALWGWFPSYSADRQLRANNGAANWTAFSILLDTDRTLNKVRVFCTKTGAPAASDFRCELYSSTTAGVPNASIETASDPISTVSGTWIEWTGFTTTLSANTMYWLVFKNMNASPATNNYSVGFHGSTTRGLGATLPMEASDSWGSAFRATINSGGSWATIINVSAAGWRAEFADGHFEGLPLGGATPLQVYSTREAGVYFVSPDVALNVKGVAMPFRKVASPSGNPRYRIYIGNSASPVLQGTTGSPDKAAIATIFDAYYPMYFNDPITIPANSVVRVVLSETTQSDASTNRYGLVKWDMENDANTKALMGSYQSTLSTDGGATFTETDTDIVPFALFLTTQAGTTVGGSEFSAPKKLPLLRNRRGHL